MTRLQEQQLKEAMQRSANGMSPSGPSSSSNAPSSSSAFINGQNIKTQARSLMQSGNAIDPLEFLSGGMGSDTMTSYEDGPLQKGGLRELGE
jgi:hypothetical protein